ncbi:MAG: ABC transporter substrate-binding protein [Methanomassiliicoccus sp.]|nr:ABC transporter substrate-binding protein [Methanomassiliicoccus sp.]
MSKKVIAIALVAVIIVAGVGAMFLMKNAKSSSNSGAVQGKHLIESEYPSASSRLWVYGNANEDDYINDADVTYLQGIIDGKNSSTTLADANCDGIVDQNDVGYLKKIINGDDMEVFYINNYNKIAVVHWPVNKIATAYCSGAQAVEVANATSKIAIADNFITKNYVAFNPAYASIPSFGEPNDPDYEAIIKAGIDVYIIGYFNSGVDDVLESKLNPQGIDVMFLTCADQAGVNQPNENMDRTLLMISYLIQGDMDRAYSYLAWHDGIISKVTAASATLAASEKQTFLMSRTSPNDKTSDISITGKNNINNIHAETAGADSIGQRDPGLTDMYQTVSVEHIIGLNAAYYVDNNHAGFRYGGNESAVSKLRSYMVNDDNRYNGTAYNPHILGMAREAGNGPMYVIEVVFYQDTLYPNLDNGVDDYGTLFHYYLKHFTSVANPDSVDVNAFFQVYS